MNWEAIDASDMPAFAGYWVNRKHWSSDEFAAFMESEILPVPAHRIIGQAGAD
ncbi:MAG: hypothetical protein ACKVHU_07870 [Acidimicrobiales bacterium]|jgi:hypothetical protein